MLQTDDKYVYVLVRKDLSLSQQSVQAIHAAINAATHYLHKDDIHPHLVLCGVETEADLQKALDFARACDINCQPFYEADLGNQLTSFATAPLVGNARRHFKRYNLLRQ